MMSPGIFLIVPHTRIVSNGICTHMDCRTRKKWIADGSPSPPAAHVVDGVSTGSSTRLLTTPTSLGSDTSTITIASTDITALLAAALSLAGTNNAAKDAIADALNALHGA
jgi:hypothetical protein